jgi:hypothetical protein
MVLSWEAVAMILSLGENLAALMCFWWAITVREA